MNASQLAYLRFLRSTLEAASAASYVASHGAMSDDLHPVVQQGLTIVMDSVDSALSALNASLDIDAQMCATTAVREVLK